MKRQYIKPSIAKVALQTAPMLTVLSVTGTEGGEARSQRFYDTFVWEEEPVETDEGDDPLF